VARRIEVEWLGEDLVIEKLRVAPDGQRVVLEIWDPTSGTHELALSGVVRDSDGRPRALKEPRSVAGVLDTVSSLAWTSTTSLVVLGQRAEDDGPTPFQVPLGSWVTSVRAEPGAVQLRAAPQQEGYEMFLVTVAGEIFTLEGAGWFSYRNGDDLVIPAG
jgi:hypothetical protein